MARLGPSQSRQVTSMPDLESEAICSDHIPQKLNAPRIRTDARQWLSPLIFVSQYMGMTFFCKLEGKKFLLVTAYRMLLFSIMVLSLIHEIPTVHFWVSNTKGLHAILACLETWYRWATLFVSFALNIWNNSRIARIVSRLIELPVVVEKPVHSRIYRFQIFLMTFNFSLIACYMIIGHEEIWLNVNHRWYTSTIYIATEFYIGFSNIQFIGILYAIRKYFKTVNERLRKCTLGARTLRNKTLLFVIDSNRKPGALSDIVKFREIHLNLSCICIKLNQCYTVQILLFLVLCMIEITYSLRSCIVFLVSSNEKSGEWQQKPWLEVSLTIFWGGYYCISLLQLVSSCDITASESRQTSVVVHELINKVQDKSLERQLQLFSIQLMNHAACFTAGGFFELDFALLQSIIGAITTYLVIIITFRE